MKKLFSQFCLSLLLLCSVNSMAADFNRNEFKSQLLSLFPLGVMKTITINEEKGEASLTFKKNDVYFTAGERFKRIFAIDSVKLFITLPGLKSLTLVIPVGDTIQTMTIGAEEIEKYYQISFNELRVVSGLWQTDFSPRYEHPEAWNKFAAKYVQEK